MRPNRLHVREKLILNRSLSLIYTELISHGLSLPYLFVTICNRTAGQSWEVEIHPEREKYTFDVTQDNAVVSLQCSLGNTSSPSLEWYDGQGKIISDTYSG